MSVPKYRSWCLTVNPTQGVAPNSPTEEALVKYCKSFPFAQMVCEKEGEARHAHIQIWLDTPTTKGDTNKKLERVLARTVPEWSQSQARVFRSGTNIAYNDWVESYCIENDLKGTPVIYVDNRPLDSDPYYPSTEEQEAVQRRSQAIDQRMCTLELLFEEWWDQDSEITPVLIGTFLSDMMFSSRKIACVNKAADRYALCKTLHAYITRTTCSTLCYKPPELSAKDKKTAAELLDNGFSQADVNKILA